MKLPVIERILSIWGFYIISHDWEHKNVTNNTCSYSLLQDWVKHQGQKQPSES